MAGPRPNGPMGMQNMPISGAYMMPGVMPGMQMMGTGMDSLLLHHQLLLLIGFCSGLLCCAKVKFSCSHRAAEQLCE